MPRDLLTHYCDGAEAWHVAARSTLDRLDHRVRTSTGAQRLLAQWEPFVAGLRVHMAEEEAMLFPALRTLARGERPTTDAFLAHLDEMAHEVDEVQGVCDALRAAAAGLGELETDLDDFCYDLEEHARREQEELLPAARRLLAQDPTWRRTSDA